ncbi:hypothetical protein LGM75_24745 [Burkholderia multivorans]|uniref:hypothetical protein n=1 Tax=Burkholderia multivorans TaxID=87883 RepID=UPI001C23B62E|nr:hypothetical protein [Burkholderia multivorans]MBU9468629.1 hypothetical protein [Burkholderia multivorans]MCA8129565.1 hypothetical protein [Burkholderia multivorans]
MHDVESPHETADVSITCELTCALLKVASRVSLPDDVRVVVDAALRKVGYSTPAKTETY